MRDASPRTHHARKITLYLTDAELYAIDASVLEMRRVYGVKVDRGRFIREALAGTSLRRIAERISRSEAT